MNGFRTFLLWLALATLHTWFFYEQTLGFNAMLFSVILVMTVTWYHGLVREKMWWFAAGGHLVSSIAVAWHGSSESAIVYYFSSFLLAGSVFAVRSSLPVALLNGMAGSFGAAFVARLPVFFNFLTKKGIGRSLIAVLSKRSAYLYATPAGVTLIFYLFYSAANPDFSLNISLPEWDIDLGFLMYFLLGVVILCPLFFTWGFKMYVELDSSKPDILTRIRGKRKFSEKLGLLHENKQGVIMFTMLNLLILAFLGFNVLQMLIPSFIKSTLNHSEQVHQGFETLIISIVAAILLIMYYFRANQNFYQRKTRLVQLAATWILLNGLLALFTCYKNVLYVASFGLTYKRIWVFIGITLTMIGLYLTLSKINNLKTNWYLMRQNSWVLYFMFCSYVLVDWDRLITWYNPNYAQFLDLEYIAGLGETKLPYLLELVENKDPRVLSYENKIVAMKSRIQFSKDSWQSQTLDNQWLKREMAEY